MLSSDAIQKAKEIGRRQADAVIAFRNQALEKRASAIRDATGSGARPHALAPSGTGDLAFGPTARGVLVAEGDSWFNYPWHDILRLLEDEHGYEVEDVANHGDRVEEMAYADGQLEEFTRLLEKLLRRGSPPKAILLSGGGNDLAGDEFGMLLNHAGSSIRGLNLNVVEGVINERAKASYLTIISKISAVCEDRLGQTLPILVHGYDYPIPDGRGFGGWIALKGPWLEPGFREKGFMDLQERLPIARQLLDRLNEMLIEVAEHFSHVHYIDLRGTLSSAPDTYTKDWANELHPTGDGFKKITQRFERVLLTLP